MINNQIKINLLNYLNKILWDYKTTETGFNYNGLILDYIFENSVYCVDFLDIEDMIQELCGLEYRENFSLTEQYKNIEDTAFIKLSETITNLMLKSTYPHLDTQLIGNKILKYIERNTTTKILKIDSNVYEFQISSKFNYGSYNDIIEIDKTTLKKIMKPEYASEEQFVKRFKYEYEMMNKLCESPYILKVFDYNDSEHSYLMERCECDIYDYLNSSISIEDREIFHIFDDILYGIKFAHDHDIIHRDLHLGNILKINNDFVICDFGLGKDLSKDRSLKSSSTPKNGHAFMDPVGKVDFTKLDKTSDIYSIAKIFEFIIDMTSSQINIDFIISKATSRKKEKRYQTIDEFIVDYETIKNSYFTEFKEQEFINNIKSNNLAAKDVQEIIKLANENTLSKFLLNNNINNFSNIIISLPVDEQRIILSSILSSYCEATEYGKFQQYDIFSQISYDVLLNTSDSNIKKLAYQILKGCAYYRFSAQHKLDDIIAKKIFVED